MVALNILLAVFDPSTIIALNVVGTFIMGISLLIISRGYLSKIYGPKEWGIASLTQTLGWLILGVLRGKIPDVISIVLGNGLLLLSLALNLNIIRKFTDRQVKKIYSFFPVILAMLLLSYFLLVDSNAAVRIAIVSSFAAYFMFSNACVLVCSRPQRPVSHLLTSILFAFTGVVLTIRTFYTLFVNSDPSQQPFGDTFLNQLSYLNFYIISIMITFGFNLMSNEKYIDEQRQTEEALIKSKKRAEELGHAKDRFLSNMSHEIRTPLNGIIGFTKLLLNDNLAPQQKHQVELIKTSSDILLVLINDLLDITKINAGKLVIEKSELHIVGLTNTIIDIFRPRLAEKELSIVAHFDEKTPFTLIGDSTRISQILINLINNSIKFTNKGGEIVVKLNCAEQVGNMQLVSISVSDNGIGINEQKLATIFEPFVQDDTVYKNEGLGLGLSIVKQLATLMNGYVSITSKINEGTTVNAVIALEKTSELSVPQMTSNLLDSNNENPSHLKEKRILLAEDNPINQMLIQTILKNLGIVFDTAENGKVAVDMLKNNEYDIILMDLKMPEMDGLQASEYIRKKFTKPKSSVPIILITADATSSNMDVYKEYGINDYITKPFNQIDLLNKINFWTNNSNNIG